MCWNKLKSTESNCKVTKCLMMVVLPFEKLKQSNRRTWSCFFLSHFYISITDRERSGNLIDCSPVTTPSVTINTAATTLASLSLIKWECRQQRGGGLWRTVARETQPLILMATHSRVLFSVINQIDWIDGWMDRLSSISRVCQSCLSYSWGVVNYTVHYWNYMCSTVHRDFYFD